jgi:Ca2+-binding RTX toxin-like protein
MRSTRAVWMLAALVAVLAAAAPAQAATFGSDLTLAPTASPVGCGGTQGCTWTPSYYRNGNAHPDGAPINGVVVRFRVKSAQPDVVTLRLAVIPPGQTAAAAVATGQTVTLTGGGATDTFETRLRAREGTRVALDTASTASTFGAGNVAPSGLFGWTPKLVDRRPARGGAGDEPARSGSELLVNADIEPDSDGDGFGDLTQDPAPDDGDNPLPQGRTPPCGDVDLVGDNGSDTLIGGKLQDNARGLGGKDTISTNDAADCIDGGPGNDLLSGNGNSDQIEGGTGNDRIWGGDLFKKNSSAEPDGDDSMFGGAGNDQIIGAAGNDDTHGGSGNDDLYADYTPKGPAPASKDFIFGDSGNDSLTGSRGNEVLDGGPGNDDMNGNGGTDRYSGGSGNDSIVSADGRKEHVACGSGTRDKVIADKNDKVASDCETVLRK